MHIGSSSSVLSTCPHCPKAIVSSFAKALARNPSKPRQMPPELRNARNERNVQMKIDKNEHHARNEVKGVVGGGKLMKHVPKISARVLTCQQNIVAKVFKPKLILSYIRARVI